MNLKTLLVCWIIAFNASLVFAVISANLEDSCSECSLCFEEPVPREDDINFSYEALKLPRPTTGLLYPRESETREVRSLDGLWRFIKSNSSDSQQGLLEKWYELGLEQTGIPTMAMPVPASYNDITVHAALRDHVGIVWYERSFFPPNSWEREQRVWLRFGSVHYKTEVWINGHSALRHSIGHLPFEAEISKFLKFGAENRLTLMCDNRLNDTTVPQGTVVYNSSESNNEPLQTYTFDFFNYAGIHRSVHLYTTPLVYISDIALHTDVQNKRGRIDYKLMVNHVDQTPCLLRVRLLDKSGQLVREQENTNLLDGTLVVPDVNPWWPYLMHEQPGYLYNLEFAIHAKDTMRLLDVYRMPVGIRSVEWNTKSLFINGVPVYLRGFGKHEDSDIRGKGLDYALLARDFSLLKWVGANVYRTSHYPYSEESMHFADEQGIMIVDECSSVNADIFGLELLQNHMSALEQLVHRDRNHASVIAWSIANEPRTAKNASKPYFDKLTAYVRTIATDRPLTAATNVEWDKDHMVQFLDIIGFNRYNAWYHNEGQVDIIAKNVYNEANDWYNRFQRPIIMFEYGADTMEGFHMLPAFIWSEDYQVALFTQHFQAFDKLRNQEWFIGEFVWNFADFKTAQKYHRVGGNKKGVFTRNRQPKEAAILLRRRYHALAFKLSNVSLPSDLFDYIIDWS
ncbi:beta-glucuronidase-like isoform X2 [Scaptodrosophila lebanonensis]|nr:beta-glucuronidase-like isoform X2 [Scaptodrosophila lebanonensis]